jgi:hypothetical protein
VTLTFSTAPLPPASSQPTSVVVAQVGVVELLGSKNTNSERSSLPVGSIAAVSCSPANR